MHQLVVDLAFLLVLILRNHISVIVLIFCPLCLFFVPLLVVLIVIVWAVSADTSFVIQRASPIPELRRLVNNAPSNGPIGLMLWQDVYLNI